MPESSCILIISARRAIFPRFAFANGNLKSRFERDGGHSSMVELQIVVLAVAGSSPVGHPIPFHLAVFGRQFPGQQPMARPLLKEADMLNPAVIESNATRSAAQNFWSRILTDEELGDCNDLQKLLVGCEIIAALDAVDLLAA